jgi:CMP-N,N'-diacetyllegionaminic acid synthase
MDQRTLCIIPARGGSKGVRRKNIRPVSGKPLIAYTIEAVMQSKYATKFVTSTDDREIAATAESYGSPILFRPAELAADDTPMIQVVQHALNEAGEPFDFVMILQPTAPLRNSGDIDCSIDLLAASGADSVVSVYQVSDCHPSRMYRIEQDALVPYDAEPPSRLRQQLPPVYHRNGAIYVCRKNLVTEQNTLIGANCRPYIMPRERSLNIDDEFDLFLVDCVIRYGERHGAVLQ